MNNKKTNDTPPGLPELDQQERLELLRGMVDIDLVRQYVAVLQNMDEESLRMFGAGVASSGFTNDMMREFIEHYGGAGRESLDARSDPGEEHMRVWLSAMGRMYTEASCDPAQISSITSLIEQAPDMTLPKVPASIERQLVHGLRLVRRRSS